MEDVPTPRTPASIALRDMIRNKDILIELSPKLADYVYVPCDDTDEPDVGAFIRYIDRRDFPPVLRSGGYVVDILDTTIQLKAGRRVWKVYKEFTWCFQKKRTTDYLLDAVANLFGKSQDS
jgi:hypothetical protein